MRAWLVTIVLLPVGPVFGAAYKWVDEQGQVHYSDRPREGAEEIQLPQSPAPLPRAEASTPEPALAAEPTTLTVEGYERIRITSPAQQQTLWNIEGNLDVTVELSPALRSGHRVALYVDGQLQDLRPPGLSFQVPNVYRGIHTLQALVLDARGDELIRSEPVTIMVQQTSILNPQRARRAGG